VRAIELDVWIYPQFAIAVLLMILLKNCFKHKREATSIASDRALPFLVYIIMHASNNKRKLATHVPCFPPSYLTSMWAPSHLSPLPTYLLPHGQQAAATQPLSPTSFSLLSPALSVRAAKPSVPRPCFPRRRDSPRPDRAAAQSSDPDRPSLAPSRSLPRAPEDAQRPALCPRKTAQQPSARSCRDPDARSRGTDRATPQTRPRAVRSPSRR
jgi:hypothetical protein